MALVLTLVGVLGVVAALVAWTMGAFVLAHTQGRATNRALATLLFLEGAGAATGNGLMFLTDDRDVAYAIQSVATCVFASLPGVYLLFLSTLDTPLARPLRPRAVRATIVAYVLAAPVFVVARTDLFTEAMIQPWYAPWDQHAGAWFIGAILASVLVGFLALAFSISLLRRAPREGPGRRRARAFVAAFTTRDAAYAVAFLVAPWLATVVPSPYVDMGFLYATISSTSLLLYVPVLAYGILKAQLFDIDLRIKWTIRRGTVVGILAVVFVVVAEIAKNWLSDAYGYLAGGLTAGALLVAVRPLDRVGARVADSALPGVEDTPAYAAYRKMEVYRAALEAATQDGVVTPKERAVLASLRASLGISEADARAMERDVAPPSG